MIATAEAHAAPPDAALMQQIATLIASNDSKRPARAPDLAAQVGGDEAAFWKALEQMKRDARINTALIKRGHDPEPWLAIWPTCLPPRNDTWKDLNARGHFSIHPSHTTPPRFPQAADPERDPRPDLRRITHPKEPAMKATPASHTRIEADRNRQQIADLVRGKPMGEGMTVKDIANALGLSTAATSYLIDTIKTDSVARGRKEGQRADVVYDPRVDAAATEGDAWAAAEAITSSGPSDLITTLHCRKGKFMKVTSPVRPSKANRIEFSLWDDGRLSIYDGDDLVQLTGADTARLARLLGVPGAMPIAQEPRA
jgi:predicted transcriptional regulator